MKRLGLAILPLIFTLTSSAQITKPIRYTWIATSCKTWNCATAALVTADGDKYVIALPTGLEERPWLVLRRVEEGSIFIPEDEIYTCEVFDGVPTATSRYSAMDTCHAPMMLSVPDGRAVVLSVDDCKLSRRRAVH